MLVAAEVVVVEGAAVAEVDEVAAEAEVSPVSTAAVSIF